MKDTLVRSLVTGHVQ